MAGEYRCSQRNTAVRLWAPGADGPTCTPQCHLYDREEMLLESGTQEFDRLLSHVKSAQAAAKWFVKSGVLGQFNVARQIREEDRSDYQALCIARRGEKQ